MSARGGRNRSSFAGRRRLSAASSAPELNHLRRPAVPLFNRSDEEIELLVEARYKKLIESFKNDPRRRQYHGIPFAVKWFLKDNRGKVFNENDENTSCFFDNYDDFLFPYLMEYVNKVEKLQDLVVIRTETASSWKGVMSERAILQRGDTEVGKLIREITERSKSLGKKLDISVNLDVGDGEIVREIPII